LNGFDRCVAVDASIMPIQISAHLSATVSDLCSEHSMVDLTSRQTSGLRYC
jgi:hypothetical protein